MPWPCVLLDLDGTLTDPGEGITRSLVAALRSRGQPAPPPAALGWAVGPPLRTTFARLVPGADAAELAALVAAYRARYLAVGMYENRVYPGVADLLADCVAAGCRLGLATGKMGRSARAILRHFGLARHFSAVAGSYSDGRRTDKAGLIRHALHLLGGTGSPAAMVGDRAPDVLAARVCGLYAVGVAWGYAQPGELAEARPDALCADVPALRRVLLT